MDTLSEQWQDPQFGVNDFCESMSMSKSNLYRKSKELTSMSPNELLREFQKSIAIKEKADQLIIGTRPTTQKEPVAKIVENQILAS